MKAVTHVHKILHSLPVHSCKATMPVGSGVRVDEPGVRMEEPGVRMEEPGVRVKKPGVRVEEQGSCFESVCVCGTHLPGKPWGKTTSCASGRGQK